jgi:two-component system NtrC family sensor kinase
MQRTVLVVDDEPEVGEMIQRMLRRRYAVVVETDARQAVGRIESALPVDLVISDLTMSPMGGIELFERVRAARPHLVDRFLLMTGGAFRNRRADAFLASWPHETLLKPFALGDLDRLVHTLLERVPAGLPAALAAGG